MNKKILAKEELIGQQVTIQNCTDPSWINKSGTIIDETKNTFIIEIENEKKRIAKNTAVFKFEDLENTILEGTRLTYRPEDRIKKAR
jgi:RNase P/RNase MRP subunit p29